MFGLRRREMRYEVGDELEQIMLGSRAVYRYAGGGPRQHLVEVVDVPGLRPGMVLGITAHALREMRRRTC